MGIARAILAMLSMLLFVLIFSLTAYTYVARETLLDSRSYAAPLHTSGFYDALVDVIANVALDAARKQNADTRRVVNHLTEEDIRLAKELVLPGPWSMAVLGHTLDATFSWLQADDNRPIPPISIPVSDIERHLKDAASVLLDRQMPTLPLCIPDLPANAYCRPQEMSVAAYVATFKPDNMAIGDKALAFLPAELDLATAVSVFPTPFQKPLAYLTRLREVMYRLDRGLAVAGVACLALLSLLWFACAVTPRIALRWIGAALLLAGSGTWAVSTFAPTALSERVAQPPSTLPTPLAEPLLRMGQALLHTVHARVLPWVLALSGLGLALALIGWLMPRLGSWGRPITSMQATRLVVFTLALVSVLWTTYLDVGRRNYARALHAHRRGQLEQACVHYQQIERAYPFAVDESVQRVRQAGRECRLYLDAESAYQSADYESAVQRYEALLLGNPPVAVRGTLQARLLNALFQWGQALQNKGEQERALDRYRFIRVQDLDRRVRQSTGQDSGIRIHQTIADLLLSWGDEQLAAGDPQAAVATYRRILDDSADPRTWELAEERMIDAYCAWIASLLERGLGERAASVCLELSYEFPSVVPDRCTACEQ
jgi:tetratricopeptide (TPR) repeat protein